MRVRKPRFSESAPLSSRSAAFSHRPKGQCSHARSAPPLPKNLGRCPAIFGNPVSENLRLNSERVNARNFLIGEALKDCTIISRKSKNHAFSSEQSAALSHRPKGQCSHARSAPPLPKNLTSLRFSGALLAHPCLRASALAGKVKLRHFYNGVPQIRGYPENRRATPEIFGEEEKQYCGACGLPFGKPLQRECCFDEAATRKTSAIPNVVRVVGLSSIRRNAAAAPPSTSPILHKCLQAAAPQNRLR